jgi:hypothetical protein
MRTQMRAIGRLPFLFRVPAAPVQKSAGDWSTYGGGYWINPGVGNKNFWFTS